MKNTISLANREQFCFFQGQWAIKSIKMNNHNEWLQPYRTSDTRRDLCTLVNPTKLRAVKKKLTALTFTQQSYRPREKTSTTKKQSNSCLGQTDTQDSSVPPWRGVKVERSAAQAMAEISRRLPHLLSRPLTLTQTSRMWFLCEMCSRGAEKVLKAGSDSQCWHLSAVSWQCEESQLKYSASRNDTIIAFLVSFHENTLQRSFLAFSFSDVK